MKIELLVNLEDYQNITFFANEGKDRLEEYEELLVYVEDWIGYNHSPHPLKLANHIRKILDLDPYEVENEVIKAAMEGKDIIFDVPKTEDKQFNKETLEKNEEEKSIEWITHEGKKYKACKYGCLLLVSWDKDKKDYVHYNKDFVYVMDKCPKYAGGG